MSTTLTATDYRNFMKENATREKGRPNLWKAKRDIPAFKAVLTYPAVKQDSLLYNPHSPLDNLTILFRKHRGQTMFRSPAIANLTIPKGALIHFNVQETGHSFGKMRTNVALCHSIVRRDDKVQVAYGVSDWNNDFIYVNGMMTTGHRIPVHPHFFSENGTCTAGIHFFLDLARAKTYLH